MNAIISVEGIRCYSYHGCLDEERIIGGHYIVDVFIEKEISRAVQTDDLSDTADYVLVCKVVREQMNVPSHLIEHVGGRIIESLKKELTKLVSIELKITKINPPVNGQVQMATVTLRLRI
jgi:7,8-dihydroneopterin aldolase/epimerase/oxygenase